MEELTVACRGLTPLADHFAVIIAAAGRGERMGADAELNKPYVKIKGKPLISYSLGFFDAVTWVDDILVMTAEHEVGYCQHAVVERYRYHKVSAVLPGGDTRQETVWKALQQLKADPPAYVAVHDAARPFLTYGTFYQLSLHAHHYGAAVPGIKVRDTIKLTDAKNFILETPPREYLFAVQTPQVFHFDRLYEAYRQAMQAGYTGTDDASLYERFVGAVRLVEAETDNLKLTTPEDLVMMEYTMGHWKQQ
jgi:2-C-methyl-D-erythritol 4-phosphate cytidylyltransferase